MVLVNAYDLRMAEAILKHIYKRSLSWIVRKHDLELIEDQTLLGDLRDSSGGLIFAVNRELGNIRGENAVVVGAGCLGYSHGDYQQLGLEFTVDVLIPLYLAALLDVQCILYINIAEEILVASEEGGTESEWSHLGDIMVRFVELLAKRIGVRNLYTFRTDTDVVDHAIVDGVDIFRDLMPLSELHSLYAIDSSGKSSTPTLNRLQQYRRTIVSYLPRVLRAGLGLNIHHLIVAENLHQVRAVNLARSLLSQVCIDGHHISGADNVRDSIDHIVFVPPPSITGTNRMARARVQSRFYVLDDPSTIAQKMLLMSPTTAYYWDHIWPDTFECRLLESDLPVFMSATRILRELMEDAID
jgi:hypothetical protein